MGQGDPFLGKTVAGERGRYLLEEVVGKGSMARVYRAREVERHTACAVKVLRERRMDAELQARFKQEAQLGQAFRHTNVVPVRDHGVYEGRPFLVMDLIEGRPLDELMREKGRYPAQEAATLVATLARTLADAHAKGILHRDVKPSNVLISRTGQVLLMDFGLAKDTTNQDLHLTYQGELLGTPSYMSPEQARGLPADARSDVHALGVILYELLTGHLPYPSDSVDETLRLLRESTPPAPRTLEPSIPRPLEAILLRAMAREPAARTPTCAQLADELALWLIGPLRPARGPRPLFMLLLLVAVGLGAGWGVHALFKPANGERPPSPTPAQETPPPAPVAPVDPNVARAQALREQLAAHPEDGQAWLELAGIQLSRGDTDGASASLDMVLERGGPAAIKEVPALRGEVATTRAALSRTWEAVIAERRSFETSAALRRATDQLQRTPDAALLRSQEARLLADFGQWQAAHAAQEVARGLDPTATLSRELAQTIRDRAAAAQAGQEPEGQPPGAPLWSRWEPLLGGAWREVEPGVIEGAGLGSGPYELCGLIARKEKATSSHYRLRVKLSLLGQASAAKDDAAFAGLILGAPDSDELVVVYVFHSPAEARRVLRGEQVDQVRRQSGAWPKFVRAARIRQGEWEHLDTQLTQFPDQGWVSLECEVEEQTVRVLVNGSPALKLDLPVSPRGRVGLVKYYGSRVQARELELVELE